jgi:CDP-diacylglycerol pyrophosphatase
VAHQVNQSPRFFALLVIVTCLLWPVFSGVTTAGRDILWQVVRACVANQHLTSAAFPCLEVNEESGSANGFAVVRVPLERTQIVIVPTARIKGVEDALLQSSTAPNFFEDAWEARQYVIDRAPRRLGREDIGLSINSKEGRGQDQMHIHVDCVKRNVSSALQHADAKLSFTRWSPVRVGLEGSRFFVLKLRGDDLKGINVFKLAARGLAVNPQDLGNMTIAIIATSFSDGQNGFYLLATLAGPSAKPIQAEDFLDHTCQ